MMDGFVFLEASSEMSHHYPSVKVFSFAIDIHGGITTLGEIDVI
jgi:hypothetical protein